MGSFIENGTIRLNNNPSILSFAAVVGKTEGDGPLGNEFDEVFEDITLGEKTWEKSESRLQEIALQKAMAKGEISESQIDFLFAGDLLNQCVASNYGVRSFEIPFVGLFGACSTMAESLIMASIFVDSNIATHTAAMTSSHYCSAERQFRLPLNYGGQRTPTAQWTVTGSGAAIITTQDKPPFVRSVTIGKIRDMGIKDAANMGAAMAQAAYETISTHLASTSTSFDDYDLILTGDLGMIGTNMLRELFQRDGFDLNDKHNDCGLMIYDLNKQDVHAGGSGCGCSASVLCGHILKQLKDGAINDVLFCATGALMSPTMIQQGESIPSIAHAVHISATI
ncbi:MAG: stage V sporulation protein AD [Clostridiales bacterium]|nr:stage V sporulation protein AD [Clostridiales bacterium]